MTLRPRTRNIPRWRACWMDENIKKILFDAAELIFKKFGLKLDDATFFWYDTSRIDKYDYELYEVKINGHLR